MARDGRHWVMQTRSGGKIVDCWVSALDADNRVDFEVGNYYTATHPASPFVNRLMLRAETDDGAILVMNRDVKTLRADAVVETMLADRAALRAMLNARFGFDLPEVLSLRVPTIEEWR
jgi:N-hydroxyarylamine O-acetyltransferase